MRWQGYHDLANVMTTSILINDTYIFDFPISRLRIAYQWKKMFWRTACSHVWCEVFFVPGWGYRSFSVRRLLRQRLYTEIVVDRSPNRIGQNWATTADNVRASSRGGALGLMMAALPKRGREYSQPGGAEECARSRVGMYVFMLVSVFVCLFVR